MIVFWQGDRKLREMVWDLGLESAKYYAGAYKAIRKADRVEVRNEAGELVFER